MKILALSFLWVLCAYDSFAANRKESDDLSLKFGDPFIMLYDNQYYAYGTNAADGIAVYVSKDLKEWKYSGIALSKEDSYADKWFWAPEVYEINGKFYMYYSADEHVCVATSESPMGPFRQMEKVPMIPSEKAIDNSLFIDDDGTPYMFFVRFNDGNNIWSVELEKDYCTIKPETMRHCFSVTEEWENIWPRVVEGPFVIKHKGLYYMTYSANSYESQDYAVGYAVASSLSGTWTKSEDNPVLRRPGALVGVGHNSLFKDKSGKLRIVFHSHYSEEKIHPRVLHISTVHFIRRGKEIKLVVDKKYITPKLID